MSRCVNCALSLVHPQRRRQLGEATDAMVTILRSWIIPATMSVEDVLCQECYTVLEIASQNLSSGSIVERAYGHQQVCFVCGSSILRAKTHKVTIDSPEGNAIMACIPTQQVHRLERVCLRCWSNVYRSLRRQTQYDRNTAPGVIITDQESEQSSSSSTHCVPTNEIKVFCPNCNTDVSHMSEGIQQDQTKIIVARVYHYFEQEYEQLKKTCKGSDLTHLSNIRQRTALATGVSESTVREVLQEEERRNADKPREHVRKRGRPRKRPRQMDSSNDDTDNNIEDDGQASCLQEIEIEPEAETVVVKLEPEEYNNVHAEIDPIAINVKVEPPDVEMNNTNEILATEPASKRKRTNMLTETGVTCIQQHRQDGSSSTQAPSSHRLTVELDESSQLGEEDIKIEIEIGEEGFS